MSKETFELNTTCLKCGATEAKLYYEERGAFYGSEYTGYCAGDHMLIMKCSNPECDQRGELELQE